MGLGVVTGVVLVMVLGAGLVTLGVVLALSRVYRARGLGEIYEMLLLPSCPRPYRRRRRLKYALCVLHDAAVISSAAGLCREQDAETVATQQAIAVRVRRIRLTTLRLLLSLPFTTLSPCTFTKFVSDYEELLGCFYNLLAIREQAGEPSHG